MSVADPFFVVRNEVENSLTAANDLVSRLQNSFQSSEAAESIHHELNKVLRSVDWDLEDLEETINIVEKNPLKFSLDINDVTKRREFVGECRKRVGMIRETVEKMKNGANQAPNNFGNNKGKAVFKKSQKSDVEKGYLRNKYSKLDDMLEKENDEYILSEEQKQKQIVRRQDDTLNLVSQQVGVLRNLGEGISKELDEQKVMLEEFDMEMDQTRGKLSVMLDKIDKVIQTSSDREQNLCILVLFISFIVLLIIYAVIS